MSEAKHLRGGSPPQPVDQRITEGAATPNPVRSADPIDLIVDQLQDNLNIAKKMERDAPWWLLLTKLRRRGIVIGASNALGLVRDKIKAIDEHR